MIDYTHLGGTTQDATDTIKTGLNPNLGEFRLQYHIVIAHEGYRNLDTDLAISGKHSVSKTFRNVQRFVANPPHTMK
jgi:hypothetical protein